MKLVLLFLALVLLVVVICVDCISDSEIPSDGDKPHKISKRALSDLGNVIECVQFRGAFGFWALYNYGYYGCYCGIGGEGTPVDESDRCCSNHDDCYGDIDEEIEKLKNPLLNLIKKAIPSALHISYRYTCTRGTIECDQGNSCFAKKACECDKTLSECLARNRETYNASFKFYC